MNDKMFGGKFRNKNILVTGHTGFIGSWLTLWLNHLGANVIGYSLKPLTEPALFDVLRLDKKTTSIIADIRDKGKISSIIEKYEPEFVFHLAAQPLVRESYEKPLDTFEINFLGTANILESFRKSSVSTAIIMTSDKCYDNKKIHPHTEDDPMGGIDPYSASKGATELLISSYRDSFFKKDHNSTNIASIRAGNVIGGGDWSKDRIILDIIKSQTNKNELVIRNPNATRPWQYVLEPILGMLNIAIRMNDNDSKISLNQGWNLGPNLDMKSLTVKEILEKIIEKYELKIRVKFEEKSSDMYESGSLLLDTTKAKRELGLENIYSIEETIEDTISWYKNFQTTQTNIEEFSIKQIIKYYNSWINNIHEDKVPW